MLSTNNNLPLLLAFILLLMYISALQKVNIIGNGNHLVIVRYVIRNVFTYPWVLWALHCWILVTVQHPIWKLINLLWRLKSTFILTQLQCNRSPVLCPKCQVPGLPVLKVMQRAKKVEFKKMLGFFSRAITLPLRTFYVYCVAYHLS